MPALSQSDLNNPSFKCCNNKTDDDDDDDDNDETKDFMVNASNSCVIWWDVTRCGDF
jgi:hypothetical protein